MVKQSIYKILVTIFTLIVFVSIAINVKLLWDRSQGYNSVRCVDCYKKTNYLVDNGQSISLSEDTYLIGETVEELIPQIEYAFPWMCDECVYEHAQEIVKRYK